MVAMKVELISLKKVEEILQKCTLMEFVPDSGFWVESIHSLDCEYVVVTIRDNRFKNIVSAKGGQGRPAIWLIDQEKKKVERLLVDFSDFDDPVIVKVGLQLGKDNSLKVNLSISDKKYKLRDSELVFGLHHKIPKKEHAVVDIFRLLDNMYKLVSIDVSI
jgi:hypothetical protein